MRALEGIRGENSPGVHAAPAGGNLGAPTWEDKGRTGRPGRRESPHTVADFRTARPPIGVIVRPRAIGQR